MEAVSSPDMRITVRRLHELWSKTMTVLANSRVTFEKLNLNFAVGLSET